MDLDISDSWRHSHDEDARGGELRRGGSWNNNADNCRVAKRNNNAEDDRNDNLGFRLAITLDSQKISFKDEVCVAYEGSRLRPSSFER